VCGLLTTSKWSSRRISIGQEEEEEEGRLRASAHSSLHMGRPIRRLAHKCFSKKGLRSHLHYAERFLRLPLGCTTEACLKNGETEK